MKKHTKSIAGLIVLVICLVGNSAFTDEIALNNFIGTWELNIKKSTFGDIPSAAAVQLYQVEQNKKEITLKWTEKNQQNEDVSSSQKLLLDGTQEKVLLPTQVTRKMNVKIDTGKNTLTLTKSYSKPNSPEELDYELTEVWSISEDGKALIIELTSPGYTITAVYDKVK